MKQVVKGLFGFSMVMAFLLGGMTNAAHAENVTFRLINLDGVAITGDIQGFRQYSSSPWAPSPATVDVGSLPTNVTVNSKFIGLYGSTVPQQSVTTTNKIVAGDSLVIDGLSKAELFRGPSVSGNTSVNIVYNAVQPTFGTVGINGNDLTGGQIIFPVFNQTHNAPYTPAGFVMHNYGVSVRGRVGTNETPTKIINIKRNTIATIDGQNVSNVTELPYSGTRVNFKFGVFVLPIAVVNSSGAPIAGDIKVASGTFQPSPVTLFNQLPGAQVAIQGRVGTATSATKVLTLDPNTTYNIAWDGALSTQNTPGDAKVNVVYSTVSYDVVVRDLNGAVIYNVDDTTPMGQVSVVGQTTDFVASGFGGTIQSGGVIDVKGRFDDLTSSKQLRMVKDSTHVVSTGNGVVSRIYTPGQSRVEFRFDAILFTTEIINELGFNIESALVRVVDYTDVNGLPTFVNSPYSIKIRGGNDLNIEMQYATYQEQFNINTVGGTVFLYDANGAAGTTGTDANKGGARAQIDDAPVTIRTTDGTNPINGKIKLGGQNFVDSPIVDLAALDGDVINIEAEYLGSLLDNVEITVKEDVTQTINASSVPPVITETPTPGTTMINVVFAPTTVSIVVTDLAGNLIYNMDGTTLMGEVLLNVGTNPTFQKMKDLGVDGITHNTLNGTTLGVRGRFDDLTTGFLSALVKANHTTVISAGNGVVSPPVSTPGVTRIEFRFDAIEFTTEIISDLGHNIDNALVRVVDYTDINGVENFVNSPFVMKMRAGNDLNIELKYATYQEQFNILSQGGTVYLFDASGPAGTTGTDSNKGGARAQIDDAPVTIRTTNGVDPIAGKIKLGGQNSVDSPIVDLAALDGDVLNIEAEYLGSLMDNVEVTVKEDVTQTVDAGTGTITEVSTPGTTLINISFAEMTVNVLATDLNGNPILGLDGQTVLGEVFVNGLTPSFVPSGYTFQSISGKLFGFRARFDDLNSTFLGVPVVKGKTIPINVASSTVGTAFDSPDGSTRVEMRFDPVVFTTDVLNDLGENLSIAKVRLVGITDVGATPTFVNSPFLAVLRNGRLLNIEVAYGLFESQFDLTVVSGSVQGFDIAGNSTGSSPAPAGQGGARTIVDDATVTIQTVEGTTPVAGTVNVELYTNLFEGSPVTIDAIPDGTPIEIEARYNGVTLNTVAVTVTEDHTITVNALTGTVGQAVSTPGTTLINLDFKPNVPPVLSVLTKPTNPSVPVLTSDVTVQGPVYDADNNLVSVVVTLDEGTPNEIVVVATLTENNTVFTAEFSGVSDGSHALKIVATDAFGATDTKTSEFLVQTNSAPVAQAGEDQPAVSATGILTAVTLDGSLSSDPDEDPLTFAWTDGQGAPVGAEAVVTLSLPLGTHTFTLTVNDGKGGTATDDVTVTIVDVTAPVITAIDAPTTVHCSPDGNTFAVTVTAQDNVTAPEDLVYHWTVDGVILEGVTGNSASITIEGLGGHTIVVTVRDGAGNVSNPDTVGDGEVSGLFVVTLDDNTAPDVVAELIPIVQDNGDSKSKKSSKSSKSKKLAYEVNLESTDHCDLTPVVTGVIYQPLNELTDDVQVKFKDSKNKNEIKIQVKNDKTIVTLYGQDESALRALLFGPVGLPGEGAIEQGGFSVVDGQILVLSASDNDDGEDDNDGDDDGKGKSKKSSKSKKSKKSSKGNGDDSGSDNGNNGKSHVSNDQNGDGNGNNGKSEVSNDNNSGAASKDSKDKGKKKAGKIVLLQSERVLGTFKYTFETNDLNELVLVEVSGPVVKMLAFATDASGNISETIEVFPPAHNLSKPVLTKPLADNTSELTFGLGQNYPNPFNPSTAIQYTLSEASDVRLVVYNVLGQQVRVLMNRTQGAGVHTVEWNGDDELGRQVATGVYIYHLVAGKNMALKKMIFAK